MRRRCSREGDGGCSREGEGCCADVLVVVEVSVSEEVKLRKQLFKERCSSFGESQEA
jgi:hypothetical protein